MRRTPANPALSRHGLQAALALWAALGGAGGCAAEHVIGSAGFQEARLYATGLPTGLGAAVVAMAAADFDGDGRSDVALFDDSKRLCVMAGAADGGLGPARCQQLTGAVRSAAAFRGQPSGPWSLVAGGEQVQTLTARGDGTFAGSTAAVPGGLSALLVAELGGEFPLQVLGAERQSPTVAAWPLSADGRLGAPIRYELGQPPSSLLYADLDGDSRPELAALGAGGLAVHGSSKPAMVTNCPPIPDGGLEFELPQGLAAIDVERDGRIDLVAADSQRGGLLVFRSASAVAATELAQAQLHFDCGEAPLLTPVVGLVALLSAELDGDGATDGVALGSELVLVRGQRSAASVLHRALPSPAQAGALADVDGDGRIDVVVALASGSVAILRNTFQ